MERKYIKKHIDPDSLQKIQAHIDNSDYEVELKIGESKSIECSILFFDLCNFTNISWSITENKILSILQPLFQYIS